jgi:glycosyltransferase involved in cell wall biosynthesis
VTTLAKLHLSRNKGSMRIALVVPHIFMQDALLSHVIFSPGRQALALADGLTASGHEVTLFTPGAVATKARNRHVDLANFNDELALRGYGYIELLKKHPLTFISLARQTQSELISIAFDEANQDRLDIVHIYTNEEDIVLPFIEYCNKPVVLTHHDPFNFSTQYRTIFPKYKHLNWLSLSMSQRSTMPADTNWIHNIYHGIDPDRFEVNLQPDPAPHSRYVAYLGRIIEAKGVHLAIGAIKQYNRGVLPDQQLSLRIAGKHYSGQAKDSYWQQKIAPEIDNINIFYDGFLSSDAQLQDFLGNAEALVVPSKFEEPFGMVMIEALACGTPIIGHGSGAIPEVISPGITGFVISSDNGQHTGLDTQAREASIIGGLADAFGKIKYINRADCRAEFETRFTLDQMCKEHILAYTQLIK